MKAFAPRLFVSFFLAMLAAGTVFYVLFNHQKQLDRWEASKRASVANVETLQRARTELSFQKAESREAFFAKIRRRHSLLEQAAVENGTLISLLENKPSFFGSSATLNKEEAELLNFRKTMRDVEKMEAKIMIAEDKWMEASAKADDAADRARDFGRLLKQFEMLNRN